MYVEKGSRQVVCGSEEKGGRVEMDFTCYKKEKKIHRIQNRNFMFSDSLRFVGGLFLHFLGTCTPFAWLQTCG